MNTVISRVSSWLPKSPFEWLAVLGLIVVVWALWMLDKPTAPVKQAVVAVVNPQVIKEEKVNVALKSPSKSVRVHKATSKGLIKLPTSVIEDDNQWVTDSSVIPSSEKRQVVTQVIDVSTGETSAYVNELPSPWVALENRGAISLDFGYKRSSLTPVGRLNVRQDIVEIKGIHLGITGSVFTDGDYFLGLGASYKW